MLLPQLLLVGAMLFVIMVWIAIHFGRKPRNGGRPPKDGSDVNIMNWLNNKQFLYTVVLSSYCVSGSDTDDGSPNDLR